MLQDLNEHSGQVKQNTIRQVKQNTIRQVKQKTIRQVKQKTIRRVKQNTTEGCTMHFWLWSSQESERLFRGGTSVPLTLNNKMVVKTTENRGVYNALLTLYKTREVNKSQGYKSTFDSEQGNDKQDGRQPLAVVKTPVHDGEWGGITR